MSKVNLTQSFVDVATCPVDRKKHDYFDTKVIGLLLKVLHSDRKSYYLRCIGTRGKVFEKKIADASVTLLEDARVLASNYLARITLKEDPFKEEEIYKETPTIAAFIADFYIPYIKTYKRSWDTDVSLINNHILPKFGRLYLDEFTKQHLISFVSKHIKTHKPGSVNRVIILMRFIFNCALKWETPGITKNPTTGVDLLEENNKKERFLTSAEANKLIGALKDSENKMLQYIIPMLILTGARKREVLDAKWEDFNFDQRIWRIPLAKSGKARHVPMSDGVLSLLDSVPLHDGCPYVFANPKTLKPFVSFFIAWNTVRKSVGLGDVRVHDLRHSFASFLINNGRSLYEVQRILGHTQIKTTQRYAHLNQETLIAAANQVSKAIPILNSMPIRVIDVPLLQVA